MPRSRSERRGGDEDFDVRLSWPSDPVHDPDRAGDEGPLIGDPADQGPDRADERADDRGGSAAGTGSVASELVRPGPMTAGRNRFGVEAFDRLAARVLERLAGMGEDLELALTAMRSEVAELRHAVDDVASRVEMRQMKAATEELRGDVNGLRRAVLEWPELEQVSSDVAGLRADVAVLLEHQDDTAGDRTAAALEPLVEELAAVRSEVATVRRRFSVSAKPAELTLTDDQVDQLTGAVVERLAASLELVADDPVDDAPAAPDDFAVDAPSDEVLPVEVPEEVAPEEQTQAAEPKSRRRSRSARRR
ncbi:hypothetical protein BH20ACT2_BH20ACT2_15410 [soil metagenome]